MFKKKELSASQIEAMETKDFFDRIVPGMIKFYTDHYICGNFYKSCWAVTGSTLPTPKKLLFLPILQTETV